MSNQGPPISAVAALRGKNRLLQAQRKSGAFYKRAARLLAESETPETIVKFVKSSELSVSSSTDQSLLPSSDFPDEEPSEDLDSLFLDTQVHEMNVETDDEESENEDYETDDEENSADDEEDAPDYAKMADADCVRYWALTGSESLASTGRLLEMLRAKTDLNIPKDPRTVLQTKRDRAALSMIGDGKFWYHGISKCLLIEMQKHATVPNVIQFDLNIDGLPLHSRSKTQFWPILLKVVDEPDWPVMIVAIYSGQSKPTSNDPFLRPLVEEINVLYRTGIVYKDATIRVYLRAIIADTPARAFLKGVQGHMGKNSCLKCCCEGETVQNRTVFLETNANKRTDDAFRNQEYVLHQTGSTPLIELQNFDMIEDIVVGDRLHQIDIGVTKKLLNIWYFGVLRSTKRWNPGQREIINHRLQRQTFPLETPRKLRCLDDLPYWKGSECKSFLHYAAPVALRGLLTEEQYQHFMLYFCGVTIFSSKVHKRYWNVGGEMLQQFVESYAQVYGKAGVTSNVHSLIHISEEAVRFGNLDSYSTYIFERKLGQIKNKLIKSSYRCLEQVIRRILERENFIFPLKRKKFPFSKQRGQTTVLFVRQGFIMKNDDVNDWFLSKDDQVVKFVSVRKCEGRIKVICKLFSQVFEYFDEPISSIILLIFAAKIRDLPEENIELECTDIKCKLVKFIGDEEGTMIFFPLLRTLVE